MTWHTIPYLFEKFYTHIQDAAASPLKSPTVHYRLARNGVRNNVIPRASPYVSLGNIAAQAGCSTETKTRMTGKSLQERFAAQAKSISGDLVT
ncbi:hypothetical protein J6590_071862 [Homalodisca vitripennis]|nr:hypothetical protein J6590_071862 [Homalodisca vitripennis]